MDAALHLGFSVAFSLYITCISSWRRKSSKGEKEDEPGLSSVFSGSRLRGHVTYLCLAQHSHGRLAQVLEWQTRLVLHDRVARDPEETMRSEMLFSSFLANSIFPINILGLG